MENDLQQLLETALSLANDISPASEDKGMASIGLRYDSCTATWCAEAKWSDLSESVTIGHKTPADAVQSLIEKLEEAVKHKRNTTATDSLKACITNASDSMNAEIARLKTEIDLLRAMVDRVAPFLHAHSQLGLLDPNFQPEQPPPSGEKGGA